MSNARRRIQEILRGMRVKETEAEDHLASIQEAIALVEGAVEAWTDEDLESLATDITRELPELVPS